MSDHMTWIGWGLAALALAAATTGSFIVLTSDQPWPPIEGCERDCVIESEPERNSEK